MDSLRVLEVNNAMMEMLPLEMVVMLLANSRLDFYAQYHLYYKAHVLNCVEMVNKIQILLDIQHIQNNVMMVTQLVVMDVPILVLLKQIYIHVFHIFLQFVLNYVETLN